MNLSPFEMKTLLYHILSGKELIVSSGKFGSLCHGAKSKLFDTM